MAAIKKQAVKGAPQLFNAEDNSPQRNSISAGKDIYRQP